MTTPIQSFGTTIAFAGTAIGSVEDITGPGETAESVDITNHGSPSAYREKVATILDGGDLTFDIIYTREAGQDALRSAFEARTTGAVLITWPDGGTGSFQGFVSNWNWATPVAGVLRASLGITVAGAVTITPA
jgi:predicted secreted protein